MLGSTPETHSTPEQQGLLSTADAAKFQDAIKKIQAERSKSRESFRKRVAGAAQIGLLLTLPFLCSEARKLTLLNEGATNIVEHMSFPNEPEIDSIYPTKNPPIVPPDPTATVQAKLEAMIQGTNDRPDQEQEEPTELPIPTHTLVPATPIQPTIPTERPTETTGDTTIIDVDAEVMDTTGSPESMEDTAEQPADDNLKDDDQTEEQIPEYFSLDRKELASYIFEKFHVGIHDDENSPPINNESLKEIAHILMNMPQELQEMLRINDGITNIETSTSPFIVDPLVLIENEEGTLHVLIPNPDASEDEVNLSNNSREELTFDPENLRLAIITELFSLRIRALPEATQLQIFDILDLRGSGWFQDEEGIWNHPDIESMQDYFPPVASIFDAAGSTLAADLSGGVEQSYFHQQLAELVAY